MEFEGMCTLEKRGNIFLLTLTGTDEHRLHPNLIDAVRAALRRVRSESTSSSSALITTAQGKYFSNGYDLKWALADTTNARSQLMSTKLRCLVSDLITLPMPTIAAVTGHASAAGFVFALCHDYILMRKDRGFLYMSELDIRYSIPIWFSALIKCKMGSPAVWREVVMKAAKVTAEMGVRMGFVDSAHNGVEETVEAAIKLGEELVSRNWDGKTYAGCRKTLYVELLNSLGSDETVGDYGDGAANKSLSKLLFARKSLLSITSVAGRPIAIDKATQVRSRPSTTRVKAELDLLDKHPKRIKLQYLNEESEHSP